MNETHVFFLWQEPVFCRFETFFFAMNFFFFQMKLQLPPFQMKLQIETIETFDCRDVTIFFTKGTFLHGAECFFLRKIQSLLFSEWFFSIARME